MPSDSFRWWSASSAIKVVAVVLTLIVLMVACSLTSALSAPGNSFHLVSRQKQLPAGVVSHVSRIGVVSVHLALSGSHGQIDVATTKSDPLVQFAQEGQVNGSEAYAQDIFGSLRLDNLAAGPVVITWSPVTVHFTAASSDATITRRFTVTSTFGKNAALQIDYDATGVAKMHVDVTTVDLPISGVFADGATRTLSDTSAQTGTIQRLADRTAGSVTVSIGSAVASSNTGVNWSQLEAFWRWSLLAALALTPWLVLRRTIRRVESRSAPTPWQSPDAWRKSRILLSSLVITIGLSGISWINEGTYWASQLFNQLDAGPVDFLFASTPFDYLISLLRAPGSIIPVANVLIASWVWAGATLSTPPSRQTRELVLVVSFAAAGLAAFFAFSPGGLSQFADQLGDLGLRPVPLVTAVVVVASGALLTRLMGGRASLTGGITAGTFGLLTCLSAGMPYDPNLGLLVRIMTSVVVSAFLVVLGNRTLDAVIPSISPRARTLVLIGIGLTAAAVTIPTARLGTVSFFDGVNASYGLQSASTVSLVLALVAGYTSVQTWSTEWMRLFLVIVASAFFLRLQVVTGLLPLPLAAGLIALFLLVIPPASQRSPGGWRLAMPAADTVLATRALLNRIGPVRLLREATNSLRRKVANADIAGEEALTASRSLAETFAIPTDAIEDARSRMDGLQWGGASGPWIRAWSGSIVAAVVGLPLSLTALSQALSALSSHAGAGGLTYAFDVGFAFRFPLYGFAFGLLFPLLRGAGGIEKAWRVFLMLAVSESIDILVPFIASPNTASTLFLRLVQLLAVSIALGVYFDYASLRAAGFGIDRLADLYNVNRLTLWSSGVSLTLIVGIATATITPAAEAAFNRILPPAQPTSSSSQNAKPSG
ncbi:hypothetical protein [Frondihabitans australicus]|uniref:Uncharacterized protein n=1 Tax=Frondihabitans australicus TaxID=386892 RepID=A0A495IGI6_9MICO|nr:hypothetical protein [Frondihabitans australicus]RKR74431.1 hypothetical protein C8E83_1543 [Frondihabitans australicus]